MKDLVNKQLFEPGKIYNFTNYAGVKTRRPVDTFITHTAVLMNSVGDQQSYIVTHYDGLVQHQDIIDGVDEYTTNGKWPDGQLRELNRGFITNHGQFVGRREAFEIAKAAGQVHPRVLRSITNKHHNLLSTDLIGVR